ncbi:MAG: pilus assembly protein [Pseudomonadota bacterium]
MNHDIHTARLVKLLTLAISGACLGLPLATLAALTIPDTPLVTTQSTKPMTMLVSGKDHRFFYEAYNDASDINGDGVIDYKFNPAITYYGLFDSSLCYKHSGGANNSDQFTPVSQATNGKCSNNWSGNWLNYATTSRIDALRKVLYGGYREVDSDSQTILRRAYIPQDAHSWAKEYTSEAVDGYRISDYTPLSQPSFGKRHFFGNLTANSGTDCATLGNCSDLPPLLSVVANTGKRVWEWASTERPVLSDSTHGGTRKNYTVRVEVCTATYHDDCKKYPNGAYKPIGLLHEYGENESMLFGLLSGSYNKNTSGGVLRKVVSSFANEVDAATGRFTSQASIVKSFNALRIRDYNNGRTDQAYRKGWVATRSMNLGEFVDWGNPVAEMMYESLRYFAGTKAATAAYATSGSYDGDIGLPVATWDDPYASDSAAKAPWCTRANMLTISDINVSFDSDQVPGSYFESFSGDLSGLNAQTEASTITSHETGVTGLHFIGQSGSEYDTTPSPKTVSSLGSIRGLAPEEPTKQGSYYSASVAYFGQRSDLRDDLQKNQTITTLAVALASPLPRIEVPLRGGTITLVPFAKSVGGSFGISAAKGDFQPTNQIVDFYVETIANSGSADSDASINGGRYYAKFRINYEDVEQGADHDMDAISEYVIAANADGTLSVSVTPTYQAGGIRQNMGYIMSGSTKDGVYLVVQDENVDNAYFLNTPPNRDPGYCDQSPVPNDCKKLPYIGATAPGNNSTRIFTPGTSSATLLKDPLWYAAKWGGFVDSDGDSLPNKTLEWDADSDGVPDTYFLVQNPLKLKESLKKSFDTIIARNSSGGNITSNGGQIRTNSLVFQTTFNSAKWSGELTAYPVTASGGVDTVNPAWVGSGGIPAAGSRNIFTKKDGAAGGVSFLWSSLSTAQKAALGSEDVLNYLRGDRSKETTQSGGTLRERASVLGDIVHASPYYAEDINVVFVGANDGMLHAFDASKASPPGGDELFTYIPGLIFNKLNLLPNGQYSHKFYVDGDVAVSTHEQTPSQNILIGAPGRGAKGVFALDVSSPSTFSASSVLWEHDGVSDADMGFVLGRPQIAKFNNGNVYAVLGNGYNSTNGHAVLYVFSLTGGLETTIDTGVGGDNGLATPGLWDADGDGDIDYVYAGDMKGNVWKFDTSANNLNQWDVAFKTGSTPKPLFTAKDGSGNAQPITAQINIVKNTLTTDPNYGKTFVFFGTGSYMLSTDPSNQALQSWYGLIDEGIMITSRTQLIERTIVDIGTLSGKSARTFSEASAGDMTGFKGWFVDLKDPSARGERIVTRSNYYYLREPVLLASSIIPTEDPCSPGGSGYVNAISPFTGGRLAYVLFDVNKDTNFNESDKINGHVTTSLDLGVGMPGEAIIIGKWLVVGGSDASFGQILLNMPSPGGRISWREITSQ